MIIIIQLMQTFFTKDLHNTVSFCDTYSVTCLFKEEQCHIVFHKALLVQTDQTHCSGVVWTDHFVTDFNIFIAQFQSYLYWYVFACTFFFFFSSLWVKTPCSLLIITQDGYCIFLSRDCVHEKPSFVLVLDAQHWLPCRAVCSLGETTIPSHNICWYPYFSFCWLMTGLFCSPSLPPPALSNKGKNIFLFTLFSKTSFSHSLTLFFLYSMFFTEKCCGISYF